MHTKWWSALAMAGLCAPVVPASAALVELLSPAPVELSGAGFELQRAAEVRVDAQGMRPERHGDHAPWIVSLGESLFGSGRDLASRGCYAWILDATSREPVWVLDLENADRGDEPNHRREATTLELPAGRYEVYLFGGHPELVAESEEWFGDRFATGEFETLRAELLQCYVRIEADPAQRFEPTGRFDDALLAMNGVGDTELRRQAFELTRDAELRLYGTLEYPRGADDPSDFGWIVDLDTGERVWDMSDRRGRHAGGAAKNRLLDRRVRLDAGRYVLVYGTDDSHSAAGFNGAPPFDPLAWGVQLRPGEDFDRASFRLLETPERPAAVIDFSRAGDRNFREQAFRLQSRTDLRILALGESVDGGWTWADHGWILDATTREIVWEMDRRNTELAGGAQKNRMFDGTLTLAPGTYIAMYSTDGSHSFEAWNGAAPFEPQAWGMQIAADPARSLERIDTPARSREAGWLADLTRVRDDERRSARFVLERPTKLEIYAVGEGGDDEMFDHGSLRAVGDDRVVWAMDFRNTEHAGGALKNRSVRVTLELPRGEYEAVFQADGSHAFGEWNDTAPRDPLSWGMTVREVR